MSFHFIFAVDCIRDKKALYGNNDVCIDCVGANLHLLVNNNMLTG